MKTIVGKVKVYLNEKDVLDAIHDFVTENVAEMADKSTIITVSISKRGRYSALVESEPDK